jgi:hypothetical protein
VVLQLGAHAQLRGTGKIQCGAYEAIEVILVLYSRNTALKVPNMLKFRVGRFYRPEAWGIQLPDPAHLYPFSRRSGARTGLSPLRCRRSGHLARKTIIFC